MDVWIIEDIESKGKALNRTLDVAAPRLAPSPNSCFAFFRFSDWNHWYAVLTFLVAGTILQM